MTIHLEERRLYRQRLEEYMSLYGHLYSDGAREEITTNFLNPSEKIRYTYDVLNQVYELIGVFEKEKDNTYDIFLHHMMKRMDINRHLLEVGCGYYPSLAKRISSLQQYGSVTAIDPKVVTTNVPGIKVIKGYFSLHHNEKAKERTSSNGIRVVKKSMVNHVGNIDTFDMLYGLYPCEATIDMIKLANIYDKDLCILACDCCETPYGELSDMKMWLTYIESLLCASIPSGRDFDIENVKSLNAPLITTKKR